MFLCQNHSGLLENVPFEIVSRAVGEIITETEREFAPNTGQIMSKVKSMISVFDAEGQWSYIEYLVRDVPEGYFRKLRDNTDDITQTLISEADIRYMKDVPGALYKQKASFISEYERMKERRERLAIRTGNLLMMSTPEKLALCGVTQNQLQLMHRDEE